MEARSGEKPSFVLPSTSLPEFLLSNPFHKDSVFIKKGYAGNEGHFISQRTQPEKPAFINSRNGATISHGKLRKDIEAVASGLVNKLHLKAAPFSAGSHTEPIVSDVVLLHLPNCIQHTVIKMGVFSAGLTATATNSALKPAEVAYIINGCKPRVLVTIAGEGGLDVILEAFQYVEDKALVDYYKSGRVFTVDVDADYTQSTPAPKSSSKNGARDWKWLLDSSSRKFAFPDYSREGEDKRRAALILWSSGTSGKSKGVILSHHALAASVQALFYGNLDFQEDEVFIGFVPFFHVFGLCNVELLTIGMGTTAICMPKFDPNSFLNLAQRYKATHLHMAPPVAVILAKSPMLDDFDLSKVRGATSGGAPLGPAVIEAVYKRLGFMIRMGYGLSETASVTSTVAKDWESLKPFLEYTGNPCPGVEVKVISTDADLKTLKRGETGEICVRSPSLMNCYLNNPSATAEVFDSEGFYRTGDVGFLHESGCLRITDRLKEVIKVKGFQVAPAELEAYLCELDIVADAGVTGTYNEEDASEYPMAYLVPADKSLLESSAKAGKACPKTIEFVTAVLKFIEGKTIEYKWIRGGVIVTDVIPKSNSGKILRKDFKQVKGYPVQIYKPKTRKTRQAKL